MVRDPAFDWSRVVVVTAADLPGPNEVAMIHNDHRILAAGDARFFCEAIALVGAPDRSTLAQALAAIRVEIEEQPPLLTLEDALRGDVVLWGADNVIADYTVRRGDSRAALAGADLIVEGTYETGHQEHVYLETNGMIAYPHGDGGIEVRGSLQCPFYVRRALAHGLGIAEEKAVVKQMETGGAFGGKEDFPSVLALHAALLAQRCERPVKMILERGEDMRATTKRHPSRVHHRTGVMRDGRLVAAEIDILLDGGAYATMSPVVLSRAVLHAGGAYCVNNIVIRGRALATNTPPNGAFRGFGAPQSLFAVERQMDRIARELGMDPCDLRRKNLLAPGDRMPFGQQLVDDSGAALVLERAVALADYADKRRSSAAARPISVADRGAACRRGIGLSVYFHGGGFTGGGEERIAGEVAVEFVECDEGGAQVEILVSNVEMGQGAETVLPMIAAQALGLPLASVRHRHPDTGRVPDSGPTVASRTTMIVGRILIRACSDMLKNLTHALARELGCDPGEVLLDGEGFARGKRRLGSLTECARQHLRKIGPLRGTATYQPPPGHTWDEEAYRGDAYKAYSWGADVVEVEVDSATLEVRPVKATVVVEIGRAINPVLAVGQIEGGTVQALGWGTMEEIKLSGGRYLNDRMATYIIPTALDAPDMEVAIAEEPYARGPFGAKGLGELPMDGGAPALAAAIDDATGLFATELPITPERLWAALQRDHPEENRSRAEASCD
jgi:CO/xanthine dehydrogenase Mo-binding subunit